MPPLLHRRTARLVDDIALSIDTGGDARPLRVGGELGV
jgi:hypothetical protein